MCANVLWSKVKYICISSVSCTLIIMKQQHWLYQLIYLPFHEYIDGRNDLVAAHMRKFTNTIEHRRKKSWDKKEAIRLITVNYIKQTITMNMGGRIYANDFSVLGILSEKCIWANNMMIRLNCCSTKLNDDAN